MFSSEIATVDGPSRSGSSTPSSASRMRAGPMIGKRVIGRRRHRFGASLRPRTSEFGM